MKTLKLSIGVAMAAIFTGSLALASASTEDHVISQKKRKYTPGAITIKAGETIKILNDDMFLHHTYIRHANMKYDSGSMEEGDEIDILFKEKGAYDVLCKIHPKMKLEVTVE